MTRQKERAERDTCTSTRTTFSTVSWCLLESVESTHKVPSSLRKGQLNRHTRYRPATTTRNMPSFSVPEETASSGSQPFHTELGERGNFSVWGERRQGEKVEGIWGKGGAGGA